MQSEYNYSYFRETKVQNSCFVSIIQPWAVTARLKKKKDMYHMVIKELIHYSETIIKAVEIKL